MEHWLCLTSITRLFAVVATFTLSKEGSLEEISASVEGLGKDRHTFPALYWVTLCCVCFLHFLPLQYVRRVLGTFTWHGKILAKQGFAGVLLGEKSLQLLGILAPEMCCKSYSSSKMCLVETASEGILHASQFCLLLEYRLAPHRAALLGNKTNLSIPKGQSEKTGISPFSNNCRKVRLKNCFAWIYFGVMLWG